MPLHTRNRTSFKKGDPELKKRKGRPVGTPNKATVEVKALAKRLVEDKQYLTALKKRLLEGKAGQVEVTLWYYAYGKPKETLEIHPNLSNLSDEDLNVLETIAKRIQI